MSRNITFSLMTALFLCAISAAAQNVWEQQGIPLAYEQPQTITANHISSANNPTGTSITYVCEKDEVYVSTDQGASWTSCWDDFGPEVIEAVPSDGREAWFGDLVNGTYHTTNSGYSWIHEVEGLDNQQVRALAINPEDPDMVIAGCVDDGSHASIYLWDSVAEEWDGISNDLPDDYTIVDLAILDNGSDIYFVAVANNHLWISEDDGVNWDQIDDPCMNLEIMYDVEVTCDTGDDYIYVSLTRDNFTYIYTYDIVQEEWIADLYIDSQNHPVWFNVFYDSPNEYITYTLNHIDQWAKVQWEDATGWNNVWAPDEDYRISGCELDYSNSDIVYVCTQRSFYYVDKDAESWNACMDGMDYTPLGLVGTKGHNVAASWQVPSTGYQPYYYESDDNGDNWSEAYFLRTSDANIGDIEFDAMTSADDYYLILGRYISATEPGSGHHTQIWTTTIGDPVGGVEYYNTNAYIYDIVPHPYLDPYGNAEYIIGCGEVYVNEDEPPVTTDRRFIISDDRGDSFTAYTSNLPSTSNMTTVWAVAVDPTEDPSSNNATYYIASDYGIYYTTDNADSWTNISTGLSGSLTFSDIVVDDNGYERYLAASDGFYVWSYSGSTWQESSDGIPAAYQNIIDIEWVDNNIILCVGEHSSGDYTKVFGSGDSGDNWFDMSGDLPTEDYINNVRHNGDYLYVGTDEGIYSFEMNFAADDITSATTWDDNVWVVNDIEVSATLTLDNAGGDCDIYVMGDYTITIDGGDLVTANASEQNKVTFQAGNGIDEWGGIKIVEFDDSQTHTLQYLKIDDAEYGVRIAPAPEAEINIVIRHCRFEDNQTGIVAQAVDALEIEYCTVENSSEYGVYLFDLPTLDPNEFHYIRNCEITGNGYSGLYANRCPSSLRVTENYIHGNLTVSATYAGITCYNSNAEIYRNLVEESNGAALQTLNAGAPSLLKDTNTFVTSAGSTFPVIHVQNAFPILNDAYNNIDNTNGTNNMRILDSSVPSVNRQVENNWWGSTEPQASWFSPQGYYDYDPWLNQEQTLTTFNYGTASVDDEPFELLESAIIAESESDFESAHAILTDLVELFPEVEDAVCQALPHILICGAGSGTTHELLYTYFDEFYQLNTGSLSGKTARHLRNDCSIAMQDFSTAIADYESITSNPPSLTDSVFAALDIDLAYLIMESLGMPGPESIGLGNGKTLEQYWKHEIELLTLLNGDIGNGSEVGSLLPGTFSLLQSYPNPFNSTTTIRYDLPEVSEVALRIYNIMGQEMTTLVDCKETAGYRQIIWKGTNRYGGELSNGLYILHMLAKGESGQEFVQVKKILLLK